jgi:protein TonB
MKISLAILSLLISQIFNAQSTPPVPPFPPPPPPPLGKIEQVDRGGEFVAFAEEMPVYPGREKQMNEDIQVNAKYPDYERTNHISGKVYVEFIVEKDGTVGYVRAVKTMPEGSGFKDVAIEAVKKLKKFEPAKHRGEPVRIIMTVPVIFNVPEE